MRSILLVSFSVCLLSACATGQAVRSAEESYTATELRVQEIIAEDGIHVVHFWAPWCHNSIAELRSGWYEVMNEYATSDDVTFTFVTIYNDGASGRETLDRFDIPESTELLVQPDLVSESGETVKRRRFLGIPITWTPTTWVFRNKGTLAYAVNYGELSPDELRTLIKSAQSTWEH